LRGHGAAPPRRPCAPAPEAVRRRVPPHPPGLEAPRWLGGARRRGRALPVEVPPRSVGVIDRWSSYERLAWASGGCTRRPGGLPSRPPPCGAPPQARWQTARVPATTRRPARAVAGQRRAVGPWWNAAAAASFPWTASCVAVGSSPVAGGGHDQWRLRGRPCSPGGGARRWRSRRGGVGAGGSAPTVRANDGGGGGGGRRGDGALPVAVVPSHWVTPREPLILAKSRRPHLVLLPPFLGRLGAHGQGVLSRQLAWCAPRGTSPSPAPSSAPCALHYCRRVADASA